MPHMLFAYFIPTLHYFFVYVFAFVIGKYTKLNKTHKSYYKYKMYDPKGSLSKST